MTVTESAFESSFCFLFFSFFFVASAASPPAGWLSSATVTPSLYSHHSFALMWCGISRLGSVPAVLRFRCIGNRYFRM